MNLMNNNQFTLEMRGEDVDAAITAGLNQLGLRRDQVNITVIDEGSKGFFGLGGREAVVKLTPIPRPEPVPETPPIAEPVIPEPEPEAETAVPVSATESAVVIEEAEAESAAEAETAPETPDAGVELDEEEQVGVRIVRELLAQMDVEADLEMHRTPADEITGRRMLVLNITGDEDVNNLIGSRGQVLNDLQYLARLMAGNALQARADFLLDVNGYREEREEALASLARRMASKAVRREKPVTLEPMSPYDRRIIHMTLREEDEVYTQSTGEGNRRRVRIYPKAYADD